MESKAPSFCRVCNVSLASPSDWRQHAKSEWHVYHLRVKVAEPGTAITPPSSSPRRQRSAASSRHNESDEDINDVTSEDSRLGPVAADFDALQCLFCSTASTSFSNNLQHMAKAHGFTIPCQERLTVDMETITVYLHLVIHGYHECIQCGCRRRTVEGIQHHMIAKGHCRFDIVSDMEEFYTIPPQNHTADAESLLLPSGKLLCNPTTARGPQLSRKPRPSTRRQTALATRPSTNSIHASAQNSSDAQLSPDTRLSSLTRGDQQSLAHLRDYQVRSLVTTGARQGSG
ncbi:prohibitin, putative [Cordyceps militaris CM01]|uniref:Prohibitin, putative n=1 Tax=Cordyceps militaris (strain CM01) TaxID=983644 RepID=G3JRL8_CORMM|nr:prohibitin, putative [Cordyceps militaris CM01]EGX88621.1 prohibitin, putative [Cordyceps militaris CM01]